MSELAQKKVLVTGAGGFMGSHLVRRLLRTDAAAVHGFVRGDRSLVEGIDVELHSVDLTDRAAMRDVVGSIRPDVIFHLAAAVNVSRDLELGPRMFAVNTVATAELLAACAAHGFDRFVHVGTCEEYGDNEAPFTEDQAPNPVSPYSASKAAATQYVRMVHRTQGLPVCVVRPFLTYGPHLKNRMLTTMLIAAGLRGETLQMTPAEQTREFNFVEDIIEGFFLAAVRAEAVGEVINIGCGEEVKIADFARLMMELFEGRLTVEIGALPYRAGETWHFYSSNEKARRLLGYAPRISLRDGLERTIEWYRAHPEVVEKL